jgi:predicted anti-sigma-YlaC factor YlaD
MMSCQEVRRSVERFLALELEPEPERLLREHLLACPACRALVAQREPATGIALGLEPMREEPDETFVAEVLGGIRQRRVELRLRGRRRRWVAAVAAAVLAAAGTLLVRWHNGPTGATAVASAPSAEAKSGAAFVEVEGEGVRVYQVVPASQSTVQVAFIVDPKLEL